SAMVAMGCRLRQWHTSAAVGGGGCVIVGGGGCIVWSSGGIGRRSASSLPSPPSPLVLPSPTGSIVGLVVVCPDPYAREGRRFRFVVFDFDWFNLEPLIKQEIKGRKRSTNQT
ncbi:hypothetical protein Dimus_036162, partial [Dionaea muscipula]